MQGTVVWGEMLLQDSVGESFPMRILWKLTRLPHVPFETSAVPGWENGTEGECCPEASIDIHACVRSVTISKFKSHERWGYTQSLKSSCGWGQHRDWRNQVSREYDSASLEIISEVPILYHFIGWCLCVVVVHSLGLIHDHIYITLRLVHWNSKAYPEPDPGLSCNVDCLGLHSKAQLFIRAVWWQTVIILFQVTQNDILSNTKVMLLTETVHIPLVWNYSPSCLPKINKFCLFMGSPKYYMFS